MTDRGQIIVQPQEGDQQQREGDYPHVVTKIGFLLANWIILSVKQIITFFDSIDRRSSTYCHL